MGRSRLGAFIWNAPTESSSLGDLSARESGSDESSPWITAGLRIPGALRCLLHLVRDGVAVHHFRFQRVAGLLRKPTLNNRVKPASDTFLLPPLCNPEESCFLLLQDIP